MTSPAAAEAIGARFRSRWWVVVAAALGLLVGTGAINVFAFGVFLKPVAQALGIGRGTFASALILSSGVTAVSAPLLGVLIDRFGARPVMLPGIVLFALSVAAYALLQPGSLAILYLLAALAGLFGAVQSPVPYSTVLAKWFDRQRGLAMAGVGLGVALVPQLAQRLLAAFGWRLAYVGLGGAILLLAFLPVAFFIREPGPGDIAERGAAADRAAVPGVPALTALRSWRFWALTAAFFLGTIAVNGTLTQVVALLTDRGLAPAAATAALSAAGLSLLAGRTMCGWCLDRLPGPLVAVACFVLPMLGIALLAGGGAGAAPLAGAMLCGLGVGAELDLMTFFASRYFGLLAYGRIYGTMFTFFAVANGIGPALAGSAYDRYHSYTPAFLLFEAALAGACLLFLPLGRYPFPAPPHPGATPLGAATPGAGG